MFVDYTNPSLVDGIVVFGDFVFPTQPKDSDEIKDGEVIIGTSTGGSVAVIGSVDQ